MCLEVGVPVLYKFGRKLDGDRTVISRLKAVKITESLFADDAAVYANTRGALRELHQSLSIQHPSGA